MDYLAKRLESTRLEFCASSSWDCGNTQLLISCFAFGWSRQLPIGQVVVLELIQNGSHIFRWRLDWLRSNQGQDARLVMQQSICGGHGPELISISGGSRIVEFVIETSKIWTLNIFKKE